MYLVVTNDFTAKGGDGFTALGKADFIYSAGPPMEQVIASDVALRSPLDAKTFGRIVDCSVKPTDALCSAASPATSTPSTSTPSTSTPTTSTPTTSTPTTSTGTPPTAARSAAGVAPKVLLGLLMGPVTAFLLS
jgi:hypothetical protein